MLWKNPFLKKDNYDKAIYWGLLITLLSLAFSIRFINSISVFILVLITVIHPERKMFFKRAFRNPYFIGCIALFLAKFGGVFYTEHLNISLRQTETKLIWIAIPFFFCSNKNISGGDVWRLMFRFTIALFAVSLYCLLYALYVYTQQHDTSVFFYHELVRPVKHHAVLFSLYLFFCIVYWMEEGLEATSSRSQKAFLTCLVIFFFLFIVLLASKLIIGLSFLYIIFFAFKFFFKKKILPLVLFASFLLAILLVLTITKNPVKDRFKDLASGNISLFRQEKFSPGVYFNGLQFRLLIWRFTYEILNEKNAWILGVSTGDAQIELNKKYVAANMYQGNGRDDTQGYLVFNCHNVFLQTALESGLIGLFILISIIVIFIVQAIQRRRRSTLIFFTAILAFCFTESVLSSQYTILLFMFFPLLSLNTGIPKKDQL
jgi:O-antigen ligase